MSSYIKITRVTRGDGPSSVLVQGRERSEVQSGRREGPLKKGVSRSSLGGECNDVEQKSVITLEGSEVGDGGPK